MPLPMLLCSLCHRWTFGFSSQMEIGTLQDAFRCYKTAMQRRQSRSTAMNDTSSRSHALFLINVYRQQV